jgi:hypothetical protein
LTVPALLVDAESSSNLRKDSPMKALSIHAERLLSVFVPKAEAEANDYCYWESRCTGTCVVIFSKRSKRLCCTSQDGSYCNGWESDGCC